MRRFHRIFAPILLIVSFTLLPLTLFESHGQDREQTDFHPSMLAFSKAIIGIDKALPTEDMNAMLSHTEVLKRELAGIVTLEPQKNEDIIEVFNKYRTRIASLTSELESLLANRKFANVPQVVKDIRHTCVSCHVKFRATSDEAGFFPNIGNVITGEVRVLNMAGEERVKRLDVVVFLEGVKSETGFPLPRKNPVISQKHRRFEPRILPVMKGTTIDFPNDNSIFHNVFSLSKTRPFDLDIYPPGESKSITFPRTGWVKVFCNIHPKMVSHIIVLDNPFFSVTDEKGMFVISGVPDGEYTLTTWHEFGKQVPIIRKEIRVSGSTTNSYSLTMQEDKRFVQHKDKFGKPYKGKYE